MQNFARNVDVLTQGLKAGISGLMNLASQGADPNSGVFFVNFNQDCTSLAVGTKTGYRLFSLNSVDNLEQIYENDSEDICIVERLFSSSLVAVVSLSSPRKLKVCHFKKGTEICNYSYSNTILAVKLNRARLVVCLEESLYIHNIRDMKVLHTIRDTPPNPMGLCTLSVNSENCFLAYPGSNTIGEVQIFDAVNLHAKTMIPAHDSPLAALAFNPSGARVATASEKGTVIRVFNVADGSKVFEFRRGVKRCVSICSLAFSMDSYFLCCSSNTETVHVFRLDEPKDISCRAAPEECQGWMGYLTKAVSASANYLPSQVTDVFNQGRAFASVHLPFQGMRNVCAITTVQKILRLLVASADGYLYIYNLDTSEGGDCNLLKQHRLDGKPDVPSAISSAGDATDPNVTTPGEMGGITAAALVAGTASSAGIHVSPSSASSSSTLPRPVPTNTSATSGTGPLGSYAGIVRGRSPGFMSDSEKFHEMVAATESPPRGGFRLDDESEFPPVTQKTE
ncbi:WD repeat domain phosphoinositide-interacting protein 2 isoform X1 [Ischnura elegans]|uniref:WD repeat domain phosphoinositide-interacting protein 2 isoform X1 n=1 Tax=Ischnura elegans TaxID=197161 RepID=UPI001ED89E3D|nr:WD repeat domain phosphoinositide-interacting protein 2 isoform X1 [Ischnura elegans]